MHRSTAHLLLLACILPALGTLASPANDAACAQLTAARNWHPLRIVPHAAVPAGYCAYIWAPDTGRVRGMAVLPERRGLLYVETERGAVVWTNDIDDRGTAENSQRERATILTSQGLSHGIAVWNGNRLLASDAAAVHSWPFDMNQPSARITAPGEILVSGMPSTGHRTRTLVIDAAQQWLYVSVGSDFSIAPDVGQRSLIRRFRLSDIPSGGYAYTAGETFASGLRNEAAIAFDRYGVLWGAENGQNDLHRGDLGGDIHDDNPAEEINKFTAPGKFYGHPFCFSEGLLPGQFARGAGTQWAWPEYASDGMHSDEWCRSTANVVPPVGTLPAHCAPLGMVFHGSHLYIGQHGSSNRSPPVGYRVQRLQLADCGAVGGGITLTGAAAEDVFAFDSTTAATGEEWRMRPVDLQVADDGTLFISNDQGGNIVALRRVDGRSEPELETNPAAAACATPPPVQTSTAAEEPATSSTATEAPATSSTATAAPDQSSSAEEDPAAGGEVTPPAPVEDFGSTATDISATDIIATGPASMAMPSACLLGSMVAAAVAFLAAA